MEIKKYRLVQHYDNRFKDYYFVEVFMKPMFSKEKKRWYRIGCAPLKDMIKVYPKAKIIKNTKKEAEK